MTRGQAHIPALDGVRGLAIALVILRHMTLPAWFASSSNLADRALRSVTAAGWSGVDLFFVLSGFLITGILLKERERDGPVIEKFGRFYWRRVLRIFPLYYAACAVLFFVVPLLPYWSAQPEIGALRHSEPWYWLYGVNLLEVLRGGPATPFNTGHFWSLAVEEQFYIVWPFVVLRASRKTLLRTVYALIVAGPLIRLAFLLALHGPAGPTAAYALSACRVDVLGIGALLALLYRDAGERWGRVHRAAPWLGAGALAAFAALALLRGGARSEDPVIQTVGFSVVAVAMGSFIAWALDVGGAAGALERPLCARPLQMLGKYSYCLYVVHYPLMSVLDLVWAHFRIASLWRPFGSSLPSWLAYGTVLVACSLAVAAVSWRLLDSRMLALKDRFDPAGLRPVLRRLAGLGAARV